MSKIEYSKFFLEARQAYLDSQGKVEDKWLGIIHDKIRSDFVSGSMKASIPQHIAVRLVRTLHREGFNVTTHYMNEKCILTVRWGD